MKLSRIPFTRLRRYLLTLGFEEIKLKSARRFEHARSGAIFLFRPYASRERVHFPDLLSVQTQLDWRGLVAAEEFEPWQNAPPTKAGGKASAG